MPRKPKLQPPDRAEPNSSPPPAEPVELSELYARYNPALPVPRGNTAIARHRDLERADPLNTYLREVRRYPLLSPDEEQKVAQEFFHARTEQAAQTLVLANLRLVVKIAYGYVQSGFKLLDLIQEGNIGLLQAVKQYDPYKGAKFSYYASFWIKAYIQNFILSNWSLVKMGTTQAQRKLFYNLKKEKLLLEEQGFKVTLKLLSERLGVEESEVIEMDQRLHGRDLSIDAPIQATESSDTIGDLLPAVQTSVVEELGNQELMSVFETKLKEFGARLSGKELVIFEERMLGDPPKTLQEIGDRYSISRERVRQLENRVMEKLRAFMNEALPKDMLPAPDSDRERT